MIVPDIERLTELGLVRNPTTHPWQQNCMRFIAKFEGGRYCRITEIVATVMADMPNETGYPSKKAIGPASSRAQTDGGAASQTGR